MRVLSCVLVLLLVLPAVDAVSFESSVSPDDLYLYHGETGQTTVTVDNDDAYSINCEVKIESADWSPMKNIPTGKSVRFTLSLTSPSAGRGIIAYDIFVHCITTNPSDPQPGEIDTLDVTLNYGPSTEEQAAIRAINDAQIKIDLAEQAYENARDTCADISSEFILATSYYNLSNAHNNIENAGSFLVSGDYETAVSYANDAYNDAQLAEDEANKAYNLTIEARDSAESLINEAEQEISNATGIINYVQGVINNASDGVNTSEANTHLDLAIDYLKRAQNSLEGARQAFNYTDCAEALSLANESKYFTEMAKYEANEAEEAIKEEIQLDIDQVNSSISLMEARVSEINNFCENLSQIDPQINMSNVNSLLEEIEGLLKEAGDALTEASTRLNQGGYEEASSLTQSANDSVDIAKARLNDTEKIFRSTTISYIEGQILSLSNELKETNTGINMVTGMAILGRDDIIEARSYVTEAVSSLDDAKAGLSSAKSSYDITAFVTHISDSIGIINMTKNRINEATGLIHGVQITSFGIIAGLLVMIIGISIGIFKIRQKQRLA